MSEADGDQALRIEHPCRPKKVPVVTLTAEGKELWSGNIHQPPKYLRHVLRTVRPDGESSAVVEYSFSYRTATSSGVPIITLKANNASIFIGRAEHLPRRLSHLKDFVADIRNGLCSC